MSDRNDFRRPLIRKISILKLYFTEIDVKEINKWKVEKFLKFDAVTNIECNDCHYVCYLLSARDLKKLRSDILKSFYMLLRSRSPQGKQDRDSLHII